MDPFDWEKSASEHTNSSTSSAAVGGGGGGGAGSGLPNEAASRMPATTAGGDRAAAVTCTAGATGPQTENQINQIHDQLVQRQDNQACWISHLNILTATFGT